MNIKAAAAALGALEQALGFMLSVTPSPQVQSQVEGVLHKLLDVATPSAGESRLLDLLTSLVEHYESDIPDAPELSPVELLKHLMEANGLKQKDLATELGGQPVVSAILSGKRQINPRQATALAARFKLRPAAFFSDWFGMQSVSTAHHFTGQGPSIQFSPSAASKELATGAERVLLC